mmetsp:Transcript_96819/g.166942  ORF Transcript_96819/g.166942 Transcript_96819/m.166942 type:complete len:249 (-) Transcript_96819:2358-3104(-)
MVHRIPCPTKNVGHTCYRLSGLTYNGSGSGSGCAGHAGARVGAWVAVSEPGWDSLGLVVRLDFIRDRRRYRHPDFNVLGLTGKRMPCNDTRSSSRVITRGAAKMQSTAEGDASILRMWIWISAFRIRRFVVGVGGGGGLGSGESDISASVNVRRPSEMGRAWGGGGSVGAVSSAGRGARFSLENGFRAWRIHTGMYSAARTPFQSCRSTCGDGPWRSWPNASAMKCRIMAGEFRVPVRRRRKAPSLLQ